MPKMNWKQQLQAAADHISRNDPVLKPLVKEHGLCTIKPHANYYQELVESIISQQLSVKAAATIERRFMELFGGKFPTPDQILGRQIEELRQVGLSRAKAAYIQDLAAHILDGKLEVTKLSKLGNQEVMAELIDIKGIGEWTAHMFLMFSLGRLDVLAVGDLGIRSGIKRLYKLRALPDAAGVEAVADKYHWHPYETVACWYIWKALDNVPAVP